MKRKYIISSVSISILLISLLLPFCFSSMYSIELNSGKIKHEMLFGGFSYYSREADTWLTHHSLLSPSKLSRWRVDSSYTFCSPNVSPHYRFHGTIHELRNAEILIKDFGLNENQEAELASLLFSWLDSMDSSNHSNLQGPTEKYMSTLKGSNIGENK